MAIEQDAKPPRLWFFDTEVIIRVSGTEDGDRISVLDHRAPFGNSPPLHRHIDEDEIFHIISGTFRFVVDGKQLTVSAGDTLRGPKGFPHTYRVESREGGRLLSITAKQQFENFVRALGRQPTRGGLPDPSGPPTPEQAEALAAIARKYQIEFVGPSLT
jgi:mannose-6-phosphate isomerase-like protein (cupin superfamily)